MKDCDSCLYFVKFNPASYIGCNAPEKQRTLKKAKKECPDWKIRKNRLTA